MVFRRLSTVDSQLFFDRCSMGPLLLSSFCEEGTELQRVLSETVVLSGMAVFGACKSVNMVGTGTSIICR